MYEHAPVEKLRVGDQVELLTKPRPDVVRLTAVIPRVNGIKFLSRSADGTVVSFGKRYGETMRRVVVDRPRWWSRLGGRRQRR